MQTLIRLCRVEVWSKLNKTCMHAYSGVGTLKYRLNVLQLELYPFFNLFCFWNFQAAPYQIHESGEERDSQTDRRLGPKVQRLDHGPGELHTAPLGRSTCGLPKVFGSGR